MASYLMSTVSRGKRFALVNSRILMNKDITTLTMPALSPTMTHGSISSWKYKAGDFVKAGDALCEIETDKASVGFDVQDDGVLAKILVDANGPELKCGSPIAVFVDDMDEYRDFLKNGYTPVGDSTPSEVSKLISTQTSAPIIKVAEKVRAGGVRLSPAARHMSESQSLNISSVVGTSKGGLISKSDIINAVKNGIATQSSNKALAKSVATSVTTNITTNITSTPQSIVFSDPNGQLPVNNKYVDIPNSKMRKIIAKRLTESKATVPHFYTSIECEIDELLALRKSLKKDLDVNISVNDIVIKACALALRDVNAVNNKWNKAKSSPEHSPTIDISVAVATPTGLITPIVTDSDKKGMSAINTTIKDLAGRAKEGKLKPEEYQGGSFSVSNLGMFGISSFSAVINPPQACILAVGSGIARILPPFPKVNGEKCKPRLSTTVTVQLSGDRRVVDEALAAQFLQVFQGYFSNPKKCIL